jgi:hypothetical protein
VSTGDQDRRSGKPGRGEIKVSVQTNKYPAISEQKSEDGPLGTAFGVLFILVIIILSIARGGSGSNTLPPSPSTPSGRYLAVQTYDSTGAPAVLVFSYSQLRVIQVNSISDIPSDVYQNSNVLDVSRNNIFREDSKIKGDVICFGNTSLEMGAISGTDTLRILSVKYGMNARYVNFDYYHSARAPPATEPKPISLYVVGKLTTASLAPQYGRSLTRGEFIELGPTEREWASYNAAVSRYETAVRSVRNRTPTEGPRRGR